MGNKTSSTKSLDSPMKSPTAKYKGERNAQGQKHGQATITYPSGAGCINESSRESLS